MSDDESESSATQRDPVAVQAKFDKWIELKEQGVSFNERLIHNRAFHNPNIAVKMLEFVGVNEHGTNFPGRVYDPNDFSVEADYESIGIMHDLYPSPSFLCLVQAQRAKWEEENKPTRPPPALGQGAPRQFTASNKHQLMVERFYSRDKR